MRTSQTPTPSLFLSILLCIVCVSTSCAQSAGGEAEKKQSKQSKAVQQFFKMLKKEGLTLDRKAKTLAMPAVINAPENDLEFLLVHRIGKTHEALLVTNAKPSVIQSGLMALGLAKGKNASFKKKVPAPTEEELKKGVPEFVVVPPSGQKLYMTVRYPNAKGKLVEYAVEDLLRDWHTNSGVLDNSWVYLGGRMDQIYRGEPPVFMADYEGNLISTCYKYPNNHILTMVHERARDEMNWSKTDACPPPGTRVQLVFHVSKPKVVVDREVREKKLAAERAQRGKKVGKRPERRPAREGQPRPKKLPPELIPPAGGTGKKGKVEKGSGEQKPPKKKGAGKS